MVPEIIRNLEDGDPDPKEARAERNALALMGAGALEDGWLAANATWDHSGGAVSGRAAIQAVRAKQPPAERIRIEQIVTEGQAGSVSGRITRAGQTRLYCHVIRFTNSSANQIAQLVSFEHPGGK
ncbi:MAG: nuclear transport factor 2 family protein [Maritimibacter sp.]